MRSRYTAYRKQNLDYLVQTTDPQRRMEIDWESTKKWMEESEFTKLEVQAHTSEGNKASVKFEATFRRGDEAPEVHAEDARFRKQGGIWYFRPR